MDKKLEQKLAGQIGSKLAKALGETEFVKTKPAFYTRVRSDRIEFIHLNKLASGPYFRVHVGIRFLCDPFPAVALEGISSDEERDCRRRMSYTREEDSLDACAEAISDYVRDRGVPWLASWSDRDRLLREEDSPAARFREAYRKYTESGSAGFEQSAALSRRLLGIKGD
ncbi:hypothetical protein [Saccharibacillus alkalitolerans]|uniref:DUF4304 domain-containing protein n=1 Tax=Saccharibacillus alkalitolerans TaxID=2705290 RepID=A0ABX0FCH6_9BACL|nr:hypothetical protein [Saccharibacillus alkalitolerans]NGZ77679.1 hypothetical protein [Saccharibacillus alkalitolerans]